MTATRVLNCRQLCQATGMPIARGYQIPMSLMPDFIDEKGAPIFLKSRVPEIIERLNDIESIKTNIHENDLTT